MLQKIWQVQGHDVYIKPTSDQLSLEPQSVLTHQVQPATVYSTARWRGLETGWWTLIARDLPGGRGACPSSFQPCWVLQWHCSAGAWTNSKTIPLCHSSLSATCKVPPWAFCWLQIDSCRLGDYILWWVPVVREGEIVVGNNWHVNFHLVTVTCFHWYQNNM